MISGYLITLLLIGEHERTGRVSVASLLPAAGAAVVAGVVHDADPADDLHGVVPRRRLLGQLRGDVVAGLLYVSNWYQIWVGQGYTSAGDFAPLRHLWSLAVEEQFYLLWPVGDDRSAAARPAPPPGRGARLFGVSLAITGVVALLYYPGPIQACDVTPDAYWQVFGRCISKTDTLYLSTPTRLGGLMLGAGVRHDLATGGADARPDATPRSRCSTSSPCAGCSASGRCAGTLHVVTPEGVADPWLFRGGLFVTGVATLAVMAAVTHRRAFTGRVLGIPLLLWIGIRSYGLYLYHWPIYQIMRRVAGNALERRPSSSWPSSLTVVVTEVSFRLIETPIRRGTLRPLVATAAGIQRPGAAARDRRHRRVARRPLAVRRGQPGDRRAAPNEIAESIEDGREATGDPFATIRTGGCRPGRLDDAAAADRHPPAGAAVRSERRGDDRRPRRRRRRSTPTTRARRRRSTATRSATR